MSDPFDPAARDDRGALPTADPVPAGPAGPAPADPGPAPTATATMNAATANAAAVMDRFDQSGKMIVGGAAAAIVLLIIGAPIGAWSLNGFALIILIAAIVAIGLAYLATTDARGMPIPIGDVLLGAVAVMTVLAVANAVEVLFDLDQIDDERGGIVGLVVTVLLAIAALATMGGVLRGRSFRDLLVGAFRTGDRGTKLAVGGYDLALVGTLIMLTLSVYALGPGFALGLTAITIAAVVLIVAEGPDSGWSLPFAHAWVAVAVAAVAALTLLDLIGQVTRVNDRVGLDPLDLLAFALYAIGSLAVLGGSIWSAVERQGLMAPKPPATE